MSKIKLPFNDWGVERLQKDKKTATSRNKKHGKPGDTFNVENMVFEIIKIEQMSLDDVAIYHFKEEGARSPIDFISIWIKIYPNEGFVPYHNVFYHTFKRIH